MDIKRFNDLNSYLRLTYGEKVFKVCLDGGFSCPNRDGTVGRGGCIFCGERGAGEHLEDDMSIDEQLKDGCLKRGAKHRANKFIAYFQNFSCTYDTIDSLRSKYLSAINDERIVALSIGTRPDCINNSVIELLQDIKESHGVDIWVELGLQTSNEKTAKLINRCYDNSVFEDAVKKLRKKSLDVIVHLLFGLPKETRADMLNSARYISKFDIQGAKIHSLYITKDTQMEAMYRNREYTPISLEHYTDTVVDAVSVLAPDLIIHRLVSECKKGFLVAPEWAYTKQLVSDEINAKLKQRNIVQGCNYSGVN